MKAMLLREIAPLAVNPAPLSSEDFPEPEIKKGQVLIRVSTCGVCHTELDEIEGRTPPSALPVVLGHQVVGTIEEGPDKGTRVGVGWIFSACGECEHCLAGEENLCADFRATGRDANGGYAEYMTVPAEFAHPIPEGLSDSEAAPLLCAGAIGYRSLRLANLRDGGSLGLTGFGGSNHLVLKMAGHLYPHSDIFVFTRNPEEREFARSLGAVWAGGIDDTAPRKLNAIIDTTPVWKPVLEALRNLDSGGRLVINAIRKEEVDKDELLRLDYPTHLWMEKEIKSVANVTRRDVREFLDLAARVGIRPEFQEYALEDANQTLLEMRQGKIRGAKVLRVA
jgi:propanol-preferring alcohol dehydrogenase